MLSIACHDYARREEGYRTHNGCATVVCTRGVLLCVRVPLSGARQARFTQSPGGRNRRYDRGRAG